jgi:hypothetical protein
VDLLPLGNERSLAFHRVVAQRLDDADLIDRARRTVARWRAEALCSTWYADRWDALLRGDRAALLAVLGGDDDGARALRHNTPFAGALSAKERSAIWRSVRAEIARAEAAWTERSSRT